MAYGKRFVSMILLIALILKDFFPLCWPTFPIKSLYHRHLSRFNSQGQHFSSCTPKIPLFCFWPALMNRHCGERAYAWTVQIHCHCRKNAKHKIWCQITRSMLVCEGQSDSIKCQILDVPNVKILLIIKCPVSWKTLKSMKAKVVHYNTTSSSAFRDVSLGATPSSSPITLEKMKPI